MLTAVIQNWPIVLFAAITLTLRRRKDSRYIDPAEQVRAKKADRVRIIKMKPVVEAPAAAAQAPEAAPQGGKA